ncbi:MAG: hypothetical protein RL367_1101 [Pseudomonadota bacterium]
MIELIRKRLASSGAINAVEEENAVKQILQEIALYALWRGGFFDIALFQGGTSLRILHGLPRFSEDLDFMLRSPDPEFDWNPYLDGLRQVFTQFGVKLDVQTRGGMAHSVRQAVLSDNSITSQLDLAFVGAGRRKTIKIRLEIDTNPPQYSGEARSFLDFPSDFEVRHQDLSSNFALKIHALLCRGYLKGRDWYDFSWYVVNGVSPNLIHLQAALLQAGPWTNQTGLCVDRAWLVTALRSAVGMIDWQEAASDVRRFLKQTEMMSLDLWSERFFLAKVEKIPA